MGVKIVYGLISEDYLMHHGVKGQKWGVRKQRQQAYGYARASHFQERRSIHNLKKKKREGSLSRDAYNRQKAQIRHKEAATRGKKLVEANENYGKVIARSAVKTAAYGAGMTAAGFMFGGPAGAIGGAALGGMHGVYQTRNAVGRIKDIRAYRRK